MDEFARAYITAALWSSVDGEGRPLHATYTCDDFASDALRHMQDDCGRFQTDNAVLLEGLDLGTCGANFWLSRNGHGGGFLEAGLGAGGEALALAARKFGAAYVEVAEDGKLAVTSA